MTIFLRTILIATAVLLFGAACDNADKEVSISELRTQAIQNYAEVVLAIYEDSYLTAQTLKTTIDAFVANPTAEGLEACRTAWKAARMPYGQSEAFRFYGGPIDNEEGPEGFINAWPIDENYIDYTVSQPDQGIINNPDDYPVINKQLLMDLNEAGSETNISTGYHAIEFLLWGQDLSDDGPGGRPYTDYVTDGTGTAANQMRRGQYLKAVSDLLLDHLMLVRDAWAEGTAYRADFTATGNVIETLDNMFRGIGVLSKAELAGERMLVAAESQDQENEHSCFSDNTHADLKMNFLGIQNVYYGTYTRIDNSTVSGTSLKALAERTNKTKADALEASFEEVETKLNAIPAPFDRVIINNPDLIISAAESLSLLSDRIADVATDVKK
ncbi:MAG: imelysin family protein [Bacteroidota bacterium]